MDKGYKIENVHITTLRVGDTILCKDGFMRTLGNPNITPDSFIGAAIWGDSYTSGRELVKRVVFKRFFKGKEVK